MCWATENAPTYPRLTVSQSESAGSPVSAVTVSASVTPLVSPHEKRVSVTPSRAEITSLPARPKNESAPPLPINVLASVLPCSVSGLGA